MSPHPRQSHQLDMQRRSLPLTLAGLLIAATAFTAWYSNRPALGVPRTSQPDRQSSVLEVLYARPFVLDRPYTHWYRLERPQVRAGWILVLRVDPELARPRQSADPVLYAGAQTLERWNTAQPDGFLVATLPAPLGSDGEPLNEWSTAPIWFGRPQLPERVDATRIAAELARARAQGIAALPESLIHEARAAAGPSLHLSSREELQPIIAELIERYSPSERECIDGLRVPVRR